MVGSVAPCAAQIFPVLPFSREVQQRDCTCPISTVAASFWLRPKRLRWENDADPMKPGSAPSECPCELMPPPQLRPPVLRSTTFNTRSTWPPRRVHSSQDLDTGVFPSIFGKNLPHLWVLEGAVFCRLWENGYIVKQAHAVHSVYVHLGLPHIIDLQCGHRNHSQPCSWTALQGDTAQRYKVYKPGQGE